MATKCFASIKGLAMRWSRLDSCGEFVGPPCNAVVSKGFVSLNVSAQIEEGEEYKVKYADGTWAINERDNPLYDHFALEMSFAQVDPDLFEMAAGAQVLTDWNGDNVGVAFDDDPRDQVAGLEIWTKIPGQACVGGQQEWAYFLLPQVVNGIVGDFTIENALANFTIKAETKGLNAWGQGISEVVAADALNTPALLPSVATNVHLLARRTTIAPPTSTLCGCVDIELPDGS